MESAEFDALIAKARKAFKQKDLLAAIDLFEEALEMIKQHSFCKFGQSDSIFGM